MIPAHELQKRGYYVTPDPWNVRVDFYPKFPINAQGPTVVPVAYIKYQDGLSLDQRCRLGWDAAEAHFVMRRLAGETT